MEVIRLCIGPILNPLLHIYQLNVLLFHCHSCLGREVPFFGLLVCIGFYGFCGMNGIVGCLEVLRDPRELWFLVCFHVFQWVSISKAFRNDSRHDFVQLKSLLVKGSPFFLWAQFFMSVLFHFSSMKLVVFVCVYIYQSTPTKRERK